jgi:nucleotide-binding universal stress UspA family protein
LGADTVHSISRESMFKRILVPIDGSERSDRAVVAAVELAALVQGTVVAFNAYPAFQGTAYGTFELSRQSLADAHEQQGRADAERLFAQVRAQATAAGAGFESVVVESNDIWQAILAAARRKHCDAICMASHGRRGLAGILLGSETQKVLTHSSLPVLVLR